MKEADMQKTAVLKVLPVSVLKPAEYNPRKKLKAGDKEYEKIKNSIEEFGFADPLVVNSDMTIIGGHQRLTVAIDLGYTEVPCAVVDIDKVREKALNIALNKITGAWDEDLLAELNSAQSLLNAEEPNYLNNLRAKYYPVSVTARAFSKAEHYNKRKPACAPFVYPHSP